MPETNVQRTIRLQIQDAERAFKEGAKYPVTDLQHRRAGRVLSHYVGMHVVYSVSLLDEWYGPDWLNQLNQLQSDAGHRPSFKNFPANPIKEIGDSLKGLRVAFAHSMGRICALGDATARKRAETAESCVGSVSFDLSACDPRLNCPKEGGAHKRLILSVGAIDDIKWMMRRVFVALNPDVEKELAEAHKQQGRPGA